MKKDFSQELSKEVREKTRKNLIYVTIFSIAMIFAGLTSAYIVSMGDTFWVKYPLPNGFWISTTLIVISSILFQLAIQSVKKGNQSKLKTFIFGTLLCGLGFTTFQFVGYKQLNEQGSYFISPIFVTDGKYGEYFHIKYGDKFLDIYENNYVIDKKPLTESQMKEVQSFMSNFTEIADSNFTINNKLDPKFILFYNGEPLNLMQGKLIKPNGEELKYTELLRLRYLAWNIRDNRAEFYHSGQLGKDFKIYYKGAELSYKDKDLMYKDKKLSIPLQNKANSSKDVSTSFLFIITALHLLHVIATLFYLIQVTILSFRGKYTPENYLGLSSGSIFWHFLGVLWLYLLLFLLFIH